MNVATGMAFSIAPGEEIAGDQVVIAREGPLVLIGLADGLGHGPLAAEAAELFCRYVESRVSVPIEDLLTSAGEQLCSTRGAAAALLRIDGEANEIEFAGVGNVAMRALTQTNMSMFCSAGILGRRVRRLRSFRFPATPGDLFVLYSDGISAGFDLDELQHCEPEAMARRILESHRKSFDDATCVVALLQDKAPV